MPLPFTQKLSVRNARKKFLLQWTKKSFLEVRLQKLSQKVKALRSFFVKSRRLLKNCCRLWRINPSWFVFKSRKWEINLPSPLKLFKDCWDIIEAIWIIWWAFKAKSFKIWILKCRQEQADDCFLPEKGIILMEKTILDRMWLKVWQINFRQLLFFQGNKIWIKMIRRDWA